MGFVCDIIMRIGCRESASMGAPWKASLEGRWDHSWRDLRVVEIRGDVQERIVFG